MIIGSLKPAKEAVSQSPAVDLSNSDRQVLSKLGLPQEQSDNLNTLVALYNRTEYDLVAVEISKPGMELDCSYILEQIKSLFKTSKRTG